MLEKAKEVQKAQKAIEEGNCPLEALPELKPVMDTIRKTFPDAGEGNLGVGSTIFAVKPGDGSAREQAKHPARKYLAVGQILQMSMQQNVIVPTSLTGVCFHS